MLLGQHYYTTSVAERDSLLAGGLFADEGTAAYVFDHPVKPDAIAFYRFYNSATGDHFYVTSAVPVPGYTAEGVACAVFDSARPGTQPLHRLFNPRNGDHFYTASDTERDAAVGLGYNLETDSCFVFAGDGAFRAPLYRFVHASNGDHFYTTEGPTAPKDYTSEGITCFVPVGTTPLFRLHHYDSGDHLYTDSITDRDDAVTKHGYHLEGIACHVFPVATVRTVPLYRLYAPSNKGHFYTTSASERDAAVRGGCTPEGVACHVNASPEETTMPLFRLVNIKIGRLLPFFPRLEGFSFFNNWFLDGTELSTIGDLLTAVIPPAIGAISPILTSTLTVADVLGALVGIPPGTLELAGAVALANWPEIVKKWILPALKDYNYGLCGGMAFGALDYYRAGWVIDRGIGLTVGKIVNAGPDRSTPEGARLRDYIWRRLLDSFRDSVAQTTIEWMLLLRVVPGTLGGKSKLLANTKDEWKKLQQHLDANEPWPIVLIRDTNDIGHHHQVLVYGYTIDATGKVVLTVYDNNAPDIASLIDLDLSGDGLVATEHAYDGNAADERPEALLGLFCGPYTFSTPPIAVGLSHGIWARSTGPAEATVNFEVTNFGHGESPAAKLFVSANPDAAPPPPPGAPPKWPSENFASGEPLAPLPSLASHSGSNVRSVISPVVVKLTEAGPWSLSPWVRLVSGTDWVAKSIPVRATETTGVVVVTPK